MNNKSTTSKKSRSSSLLPLVMAAGLAVTGWGLSSQTALADCAFDTVVGYNPNGIFSPELGEQCDDGNLINPNPDNTDTCTNDCLIPPNCIDDVTGRTNVCTANDVQLSLVLNESNVACELGETVDLQLTGVFRSTAAERWDIGTFIALDGGDARTGTCYQDYIRPPLTAGGICSQTGEACVNNLSDPGLDGCPATGVCDDGATACNDPSECLAPTAGNGTCLVTGEACVDSTECAGNDTLINNPCVGICGGTPGPQECTGGYFPTNAVAPFYDGEDDVDPLDTCGDLEQGVDTYYRFVDPGGTPKTITVLCQDDYGACQGTGDPCEVSTNDGCTGQDVCIADGKVDFGSCVSWDNARSDEGTGGNKPACTSEEDAVPNTKSKCRCEVQNVGNVFVAGKIIVDKVCDDSTVDFDFTTNFDFQDPNADKKVACGESAESVALQPSEISGTTYSVSEDPPPEGWYLFDVTCTSDGEGNPTEDPAAIDLGSGETVTCVFTNIRPSVTIDKTGDALSKVGDDVSYTITVENTSSADTPDLVCTITDALLGINKSVTLASGATDTTNASYTVPSGAPDPLPNTASVNCDVGVTGITVGASDGHSVDLIEPAFSVTKTGDALSKVGDDVDYTITLSNTSSANTPDLTCTATDTLLGVVYGPAVLPAGDTVLNPTYTVPVGAPNPLNNTVTLSCTLPDGFTNVLEDASDSHSVDLIEPAFSVTKTGDALSKVGDDVDYTITLSNTSSANTPDLTCTATDTLLGVVYGPAVLPAGDTVLNPTYTVPVGAPNPLNNTVTLSCTLPDGFTNVLEDASDSHSVDLIEPAFSVTKTGDALSKVGDDVDYTITLSNTSSANTPDLTCTATDTLLGVVYGPAVLPAGDTVLNPTYTVPVGAPNPLNNTVTLSCTLPDGFTNVLEDASDSHSVDLIEPAFSVTKTGDALSKVGDDVDYTITLSNTSSANTPDLTCTATDTLLGVVYGPAVLPAGDTVLNPTYTVPVGAPNPLNNTVTLSCTLPDGFTNVLEDASDSHSVDLIEPAFSVTKTGDALSKVGDDVDYTITLSNTSSANTPDLTCTATDTLLGVVYGPAVLPAGDTVLNPTYTVPVGAPNPLNNTVTLSCTLPDGFTNVLEDASDSHSVDLIEPAFSVTKTGDALSKVGDDVDYTITLSNTSSANTPDLTCTATDTLLGVVYGPAVLPAGDTVLNPTYTVPVGAPNPLNNTVTLSCTLPDGFTNVLEDASDSHSVDLIEPAFSVTKTGDALSKVGDDVDYTITLSNTSSANTPDLTCTATDTLLGVVYGPAVLPAGDTVLNPTYTVPVGAPNPLNNTVTLSCTLPDGFTNVLEDASDSHSVDLIEPAFSVTKTGDALSKVGDDVDYTITLSNTSSANTPDLTCTATDTLLGVVYGPAVLPAGDTVLNPTYTVPVGAPNPLNNTVTLSCTLPDGFTNVLEDASDSHSVDLIEPAFSVTKTGDALSKVGDDVDYTITLSNTSSANTPDLTCTATDTLLGVVYGPAVLPAGDTVLNPTYTVPVGAPNPLNNTVTLSCTLPDGFTNVLEDASDSHSVDLIEPAFSVTKTGDALSKVGDDVDYTITLSNTSSANTPDLTCTATDTLLGVVYGPAVLPAGDTVLNPTYTVPVGAPNPLNNTVTLSCTLPDGFTNVLEDASDSHSVDLIEPAFSVTKTGDATSKVGDDVDYTITLTNSSSGDTPPLTCTATDTLLGTVFGPAVLPAGDTVLNPTYTVPVGAPDPLVNTVTLSCALPAGFTNVLSNATDSHSVDLVEPGYTVVKSCTNEPVPQDGLATWDILVTNTGDVALDIVLDDGAAGVINVNGLGAGLSTTVPVSLPGPFAGQTTVSNTVSSTATLAIPGTYTNVITPPEPSTATCIVAGEAKITKLTQGLPNEEPNPNAPWTFTLQDCGTAACTKDSTVIAQVTSPPSMVEFGVDLVPVQQDPNQTYRLCEVLIPAAWTNTWKGDADDDGTPETQIPFVPAVSDDPVDNPPGWSNVFDPMFAPPPAIWTNDERCLNFVADAGATEVFEIDNRFPGGEPRTIGYWKNWDSCSGGGQVFTAIELGGETSAERLASGRALLDDVLQAPGITIGTITLIADDDVFACDEGTQNAVYILDKRSIDGNNKKRANDAAYGLAAQLLAAIANTTAGAGVCPEAGQAIIDGQTLLFDIGFNGTGGYYTKKVHEIAGHTKQEANTLAGILDSYNNGTLCAL